MSRALCSEAFTPTTLHCGFSPLFFFFLIFFFNIYLFLRQRETEREQGEGQRERETQNLKQAPGSELSVSTEPDMGLKPTSRKIMT